MDKDTRDLPCKRVHVHEIWTYVGRKQRQVTELDVRLAQAISGLSRFGCKHQACLSYLIGECNLPTADEIVKVGRGVKKALANSDKSRTQRENLRQGVPH